jgi:NDP-sugar pyrophosphorylase family protein
VTRVENSTRTEPGGIERGFPTTAILLAGGLGTRLQEKLAGRPKALALAAGKPFLDYLLEYLAGQRIRRIILSIGYLGDQIQDHVGDGHRWGLEVTYAVETQPLGTGGALRFASKGLQTPFFAMNADTLYQVNLDKLAECHWSTGADLTIALRKVPLIGGDIDQRGCVQIRQDGRIISFREKTIPESNIVSDPSKTTFYWTNGGIYLVRPQALDWIKPEVNISLEQDIFPNLSNQGQLYGCPLEGFFIDIGTPQSLARFEADILQGRFNPRKT